VNQQVQIKDRAEQCSAEQCSAEHAVQCRQIKGRDRAIQTRDQVEDIAAQTVVSPATICENHFRARDSGTPWGYLAPTMDCRLPPLRERERRGGGGRVMRKREIGERKGDRREGEGELGRR
jgi:hypothetical protein